MFSVTQKNRSGCKWEENTEIHNGVFTNFSLVDKYDKIYIYVFFFLLLLFSAQLQKNISAIYLARAKALINWFYSLEEKKKKK